MDYSCGLTQGVNNNSYIVVSNVPNRNNMFFLHSTFEANAISSPADWIPLVLALFATATAVLTTVMVVTSQQRAMRRNEIYKRLNEFYGPIEQYLKRSQDLYGRFSSRLKMQNPGFQTLPVLLDSQLSTFTENERILLKEIIKCGEQMEKLIFEKSGLIDDAELTTIWLPKLTHHLLIFRLAYHGELKGDRENIADDVFPEGIDGIVAARKRELIDQLAKLGKIYDPV
jgi:hypothetical protein